MNGILPYRDHYPRLGNDVYIAPGAWVIGDVVIGDNSSIWFNTVVRGDVNYIRIGKMTNIQDNAVLHVTGERFPLLLGNRITVGHRAIVHGCVIEDDCLVGMGAIVMDGAHLGHGSLVAAGSVVTPGFVAPPRSLVVGVPAVVKKEIGEKERLLMKGSVEHYLDLCADYMNPAGCDSEKRVRGFLG